MKRNALVQARLNLITLNEICTELEGATDLRLIERRWSEFLDTIYKIQEKLEKLAPERKKHQDISWVKKIIKEREEDELLKYLRMARGVINHGLEKVTLATEPACINFTVINEYNSIIGEKPNWEKFVRTHKAATFYPWVIKLASITTKEHGKSVVFNPPIEHMGRMLLWEIAGLTPRLIVKIVVLYFSRLIDEAETV